MWHSERCQLGSLVAALGSLLLAAPIAASPFGTSYTATAANFPGTDTAVLAFDGLDEALGSSGLVVGETSTTLTDFELIEFSLRTADGEPFVGQQGAPSLPASVLVTDLQRFADSQPVEGIARTGFVWLSIDGEPQDLSDVAGLGLVFGTHPLHPTIPVLLIENVTTSAIGFGSFGQSAQAAFAALVGPELADEIDAVHFGVAAVPVPEPGATSLLVSGAAALAVLARRRSMQRRE